MNDTTPEVERLLRAHYAGLSGPERVRIAAGMFETARALVFASLPVALDPLERRAEFIRRVYPELEAHSSDLQRAFAASAAVMNCRD